MTPHGRNEGCCTRGSQRMDDRQRAASPCAVPPRTASKCDVWHVALPTSDNTSVSSIPHHHGLRLR